MSNNRETPPTPASCEKQGDDRLPQSFYDMMEDLNLMPQQSPEPINMYSRIDTPEPSNELPSGYAIEANLSYLHAETPPRYHNRQELARVRRRLQYDPSDLECPYEEPVQELQSRSASPQPIDVYAMMDRDGPAEVSERSAAGISVFEPTMPSHITDIGSLPEYESFGAPIGYSTPHSQRSRLHPQSSSPRTADLVGASSSPMSADLVGASSSPMSADLVGASSSPISADLERTMPAHSTAIGSVPGFESFGSPITYRSQHSARSQPPSKYFENIATRSGAAFIGGSSSPRSCDLMGTSSSPRTIDLERTMPGHSTAIGFVPGFESFGSPIASSRQYSARSQPPSQYLQNLAAGSGSHTGGSSSPKASGASSSPRTCDLVGSSSCPKSSNLVGASSSPRTCDLVGSSCLKSCNLGRATSTPKAAGSIGISSCPKSGCPAGASSCPKSCDLLEASFSSLSKAKASTSKQPPCPCAEQKRTESFMEKFDKEVEKELSRYRHSISAKESVDMDISVVRAGVSDTTTLVNSAVSDIDIIARMKGEQDTELTEACEKLAKAEQTIMFEGAVEAAEEAAANAPPEYAEEAAAAGARAHTKIYQAELTGSVQQTFPGVRPIEVVGYVGVTRPRKPKKPVNRPKTCK